MTGANHTAVAEVMQHLPPIEQGRVLRLIERRAKKNPRFRDRLDAAKAKAEQDSRNYEDWIIAQAQARELAEDVPW